MTGFSRNLRIALLGMVALVSGAHSGLAAKERNRILGIDVEKRGAGRLVRIRTEATPTFTVFRLSDPMRVVVDLSSGDLTGVEPVTVEDGVLEQIAVRQFNADGFAIARVIVGFDKEAPYDVKAQGNAVVVTTGEVGANIELAAPPPVAPVDRAAAERLESVRAEVDAAKQQALADRRAADTATQNAKREQEAALKVSRDAERLAEQARAAKSEAEKLREQALTSAAKDKSAAEAALAQAESRQREVEAAAREIATKRAAAERLATQAEQTRRDAEQAAAEADARHKQRLAEIEEQKANAQKEKKAAEEARGRAAAAKKEAEEATTRAAAARAEADKSRAETSKKLAEINARAAQLDAAQTKLDAAQSKLDADKQRIADKERELAQKERQLAKAAAERARPEKVEALVAPPPKRTTVAELGATRASEPDKGLRLSTVKTDGDTLVFGVDGEPRYEAQRLEDPPRLVLDFDDTARATKRLNYELKNTFVARVRLGEHGDKVRAVLDLSDASLEHTVTTSEKGLRVQFKRPAVAMSAPQAAKPVGASVRDVRFDYKDNVARVVLELDGAASALIDDRSPKSWVMSLRDVNLPKSLERSLDTSAYGSVVRLISSYTASETPHVVNIVASLNGPATHALREEGNRLVWEIKGEAKRSVVASVAPETAGFATEAAVLATTTAAQSRQKRVNMRLKDADLVNVIRFIADLTGENIIVAEDVKGTVTVNLRNVPWEQALDTILKTRGYDKRRDGNIIRIASSDQLAKELDQEAARKRAAVEVDPTFTNIVPVNYATARDILDQVKATLSLRGTVQTDERTNKLIINDLRENLDKATELVRQLDKQTPQVLIEARIVEAATNYVEELGIQWGGTGQATARTGNPTGLQFPGDVIASGAADDTTPLITNGTATPGRFAVNLPAPIGAGAGGGIGFIFGSAGGSQLLNLRLTALENNGSGRIISSPRVATLDNRVAKISQGVSIPITVTSAAGANTRFIDAALQLEVTPHVTNDGTVILKIKTEKSEPDFGNRGAGGDPTIVKKAAETEVMVRDGDTAVIGGIYTRTTSENSAEVPFFSKIPVLGWLFKKHRTEDRRAELLVFITPRIVNREAALGETANAAPPPSLEEGPAPQ